MTKPNCIYYTDLTVGVKINEKILTNSYANTFNYTFTILTFLCLKKEEQYYYWYNSEYIIPI